MSLFIDDQRLNQILEIGCKQGIYYNMLYRMLKDRGLRYEWYA